MILFVLEFDEPLDVDVTIASFSGEDNWIKNSLENEDRLTAIIEMAFVAETLMIAL